MRAAGDPSSIAIVGAGLAGLSAAVALGCAGFAPRLFEREAALEPIGAGIQLGPNATRILKQWNVDVSSKACEPQFIEFRRADTGALLNRMPLGQSVRSRYGSPYLTLLRADLQNALLERVSKLGIDIAFKAKADAIEQKGETVYFTVDAAQHATAILLGADGIHSHVRAAISPRARLYETGATAWRALLPSHTVPAPFRDIIILWMSPGAHLVQYPVSKGAAFNAVLVAEHGADHSLSHAREFPAQLVAKWVDPVASMIGGGTAWTPWPLTSVEETSGGLGRIQLIGDAWHAMPPYLASGAVMAIEDGAAFASCANEARGDAGATLRRFREVRTQRVWRVHARSAQAGRLYHCPAPFATIRDAALRAMPAAMLLARNDWLFGRPA